MNALVELNLALILFLPWYALLGWVFWRICARGRGAARKMLALAVLILALIAAAAAGIWAFGHADPSSGAIWRQVLACVVGYGAFLAVLAMGLIAWRRPAGTRRQR